MCGIGERQTVESHLRPTQALIVFEAALLFPEHDDQRAAQDVASRVAQRLLVLRVARTAHHASLALLQPALTIPEVGLHVRIWWVVCWVSRESRALDIDF